jgi:hypothetical protein
MMMSVGQSVEWELAEETEALSKPDPAPLDPPQIPHDLRNPRNRRLTV